MSVLVSISSFRYFNDESHFTFSVLILFLHITADVIGTIVSISDLIPFTKYGKEKKRRNLIIEDIE